MSIKDKLYAVQLEFRQRSAARSYRSAAAPVVDPRTFAPKKVLFVLSGLIGDSVMSLAAIYEARRLWPESEIKVLGKRHNRELLKGCGYFDEFYECNADPFSLRRSDEVEKLAEWLKNEHFDAAIILLGDQFAHLLARAGIPVRVGVKNTRLEPLLTHTYDIGSPRTWGVKERLGALGCLGYPTANSLPTLYVTDEARLSVQGRLAELGLQTGQNYVVLHPFGSTRRQWWDLNKAADLAAELDGFATIIVGGDKTIFPERPRASLPIVNSTGKLTLPELIAAIDGAALVISTDSGPFHIAGALGKPLVGLFRSRRPEHANQYPSSVVVLGKNEKCMKSCKWDHCQAEPCRQMNDIAVAEVKHAVEERLAAV